MIPGSSPHTDSIGLSAVTDLYLRVRQAEGRLYPDEIVSRLPDFPNQHPLRQEWLARADSAQRLCRYLAARGRRQRVLDLGCGNGWLSHLISTLPDTKVWGLDRPGPEVAQAARLFKDGSLAFLVADIDRSPFSEETFDVIVLASVIQYFDALPALIQRFFPLLEPGGEIHILDSPLYAPDDLLAARQRSADYYAGLGYPEMAAAYFHHPASALDQFRPDYLYRPDVGLARFSRRLGRIVSPFPWVRLRRAS